jgi:hypothetical protein
VSQIGKVCAMDVYELSAGWSWDGQKSDWNVWYR